jgi:hypothetical protein
LLRTQQQQAQMMSQQPTAKVSSVGSSGAAAAVRVVERYVKIDDVSWRLFVVS